MDVSDGGDELAEYVAGVALFEAAVVDDHFEEVFALDVLAAECEVVVSGYDAAETDDVLVVDEEHHCDFAVYTLFAHFAGFSAQLFGGVSAADDFDGDCFAGADVFAEVDGGGASLADLGIDFVLANETGDDLFLFWVGVGLAAVVVVWVVDGTGEFGVVGLLFGSGEGRHRPGIREMALINLFS